MVTHISLLKFLADQYLKISRSCSRDNIQRYASNFLTVGEKLWWADQGTDRIGTCDKKDGGNWKVLRNNTSPVMHMRIYDEDVQKGKKYHLRKRYCMRFC